MNLRDEYPAGSRWVVIQRGLRLSGWKADPKFANAYSGVRRDLSVGDVIECDGFGPGWGADPGYGVNWRDPEFGKCDLWPATGGVFSYRPPDGSLRRVADDTPCSVTEPDGPGL